MIKVSAVTLNKMIEALENEGIFFEGQFDDGLLLGHNEIYHELIEMIKEESGLENVFCLTNENIDWVYYIYNAEIISPLEIEKVAYRIKNS